MGSPGATPAASPPPGTMAQVLLPPAPRAPHGYTERHGACGEPAGPAAALRWDDNCPLIPPLLSGSP